MAISFLTFATQPFKGQPFGIPIQTGKPPTGNGPATVRISVPWNEYGASTQVQQVGVDFNLLGQATALPIDSIRSIYIDNTFVSVPVYVTFPDSLQTVLCPAYSVVCCPVMTNLQQGTVYAEGFQTGENPITTVFFTNVTLSGFYIPASTGAGNGSPVIPVILNYTGKQTYLSNGGWTWPDVPFGDPDVDRVIAICLNGANLQDDFNWPYSYDTVTIGGIAATRHVQALFNGGISRSEIWSAVVPTGTSGPITVTATSSINAIVKTEGDIYAMRNLKSPIPLAVGSRNNQGYQTMSLPILANGIVLSAATKIDSSDFAWLNVQQNSVTNLGVTTSGHPYFGSSASAITSTDGNLSISSSSRSFVGVSWN